MNLFTFAFLANRGGPPCYYATVPPGQSVQGSLLVLHLSDSFFLRAATDLRQRDPFCQCLSVFPFRYSGTKKRVLDGKGGIDF